ncbi:hypothetical protein BH11MYX3_BH11MYX3_12650 [soil metagenome]
MRLVILVVLALGPGCDRVFGLHGSQDGDAATGEAGEAGTRDAGISCPARGGTPTFSTSLRFVASACSELSGSAIARSVANCTGGVSEGPETGPLTPVAGLESMGDVHYDAARMVPEGDLLFVREWDVTTLLSRILILRRRTGNTFAMDGEVMITGVPLDTSARFGVPSRGPIRRMFVRNLSKLFEVSIDGTGVATPLKSYNDTDLGVDTIDLAPGLSPDGLRLVFGGRLDTTSGIYYADRASTSDSFGPARKIPGAAYAYDPWLADGCAELVFSVGSSLYAAPAIAP